MRKNRLLFLLPALATVFQKIGLNKMCASARYNEGSLKSITLAIAVLADMSSKGKE